MNSFLTPNYTIIKNSNIEKNHGIVWNLNMICLRFDVIEK